MIHIHAGYPILLSHQLDVIRRVSLWLLDCTPLTDWLPTKSLLYSIQHTGVGLSPYPHSLGISGSVTSWLLPGSLPPTCRRLKNVRGYRSLLMITLLAQTLAVIQQLRHKPWTPTTTPRSWAVYLPSSMQWQWQSWWHLVTSGHVMSWWKLWPIRAARQC